MAENCIRAFLLVSVIGLMINAFQVHQFHAYQLEINNNQMEINSNILARRPNPYANAKEEGDTYPICPDGVIPSGLVCHKDGSKSLFIGSGDGSVECNQNCMESLKEK